MQKGIAILVSILILSAQAEYLTEWIKGHEHIECTSAKHHLHKTDFDCDHAGVFYAPLGILTTSSRATDFTFYSTQALIHYNNKLLQSQLKFVKLLRGPPLLVFFA